MIKWNKGDGYYYSDSERFTAIKSTDRIYSGDWELYDEITKTTYHEYTLKECKNRAEIILKKVNA